MKRSLFISLAISLFGTVVISNFFSLSSEEAETGANLGIYGISLLLPFILLSLFITVRFFTQYVQLAKDRLTTIIILIFMIIFSGAVFYFARDYANDLYETLGGTTDNPQSKIFNYPLLNAYTYSVFINMYTFLLIHVIAAILGMIIGLFKPQIASNNDN